MNYLLHLLLSEQEEDCYVGNLMGDFVKGRLESHAQDFAPAVIRGLKQHRRIDSYAQQSAVFKRSYRRLDDDYGLYRGIMVDLFYDHFAARHWQRFHPRPLPDFAHMIYTILSTRTDLPPAFAHVAARMREHNLLVAYTHSPTIERALNHISTRARAPNPLHGAVIELQRNYSHLEQDCMCFIQSAMAWTEQHPLWNDNPYGPE
ncbi:MAG: ACP phosphodiesterase [Desulfuromonadaceae bacterium]|nr:ACP phosphodiesterase [Desulfuromonadaceae bacterium]